MIVAWLLLGCAVVYVLVVAIVFLFQRRLLYPMRHSYATPAGAGFPEAEEHVLTTDDGERVIAWLKRPADESRPLLLMLLGNGDGLAEVVPRLKVLSADGSGVLALAYRGYSGSSGSPTEQGLMLDGEAAWRFAAGLVEPRRIVLVGYSLGSGVAVPLAARHAVGAVILIAPFSSSVAAGAHQFPWLPVKLLMKDRFASIDAVGRLRAPLLVVHGERDTQVPIALGHALYEAAPQPKRFVALPDADHFTTLARGGMEAINAFLRDLWH